VQRTPFTRLVAGPRPAPDRIAYTNLWFRGHNNPRYAELLPRLERLDRYLIVCSGQRITRGIQYRALRATRYVRDPLVLRALGRRYRFLFSADNEQIPHFPGPVVSDVDDPKLTPREAALLNRPNVAAYVVTHERAARRLEELGVEKPWHVIPQGLALGSLTPERAAAARAARPDGAFVLGYVAAWLLSADDRDGANARYNVDHLLELWEEIRVRVPRAQLWLVGEASDRVRRRCVGRDVVLFGRLAKEEVLPVVSAFDVALYPRTEDQGIRSAKVAEYMGAGVPTVSYDFEVTGELREAGAGVLVGTPREFVDAVARLAADGAERVRLAEAARAAGAALDWDALARRYETEILDVYLR
jgi:glycosyltransferase involved in cell wall biosynthesis